MEPGVISQIIRTRRRTLALQIAPDARLIVRAPRGASEEKIRKAVRDKMSWILEKQRLARERFRPPVKFADGEQLLYLGKWHKLLVVPGASVPLVFNETEFLLSEKYLPEARPLFEKWYRGKAIEVIGARARQYAEATGLKYANFSVTGAKKRWGSCSVKGSLNFSWRLVMAPPEVVDYVIIHELVHLDEHNHSSDFWRKVRGFFPDYSHTRRWLRNNHQLLTL